MSGPESLNNLEPQNNNISQPKDYSADVTKYENHYKNNSNAQELINKQNTDSQEINQRKEQEIQNTRIETGKQEQELSKEILTPENIDKFLNTYTNRVQDHKQALIKIHQFCNNGANFKDYQEYVNFIQEIDGRTIRILNGKLDFDNLIPEQQQRCKTIIQDLDEIINLQLGANGMFKVNERVKREEKEKILEVKVENVDKSSEELGEIDKKDLFLYFGLDNEKSKEIFNKIDEYNKESGNENIKMISFLKQYKSHIDTKLKGLEPIYTNKIKKSIGLRVLQLGNIITERINFVNKQIREGDYKQEDRTKELANERWNINHGLVEYFEFVDNQLLPSAEVLIKVKNLDKNKFTDDEWYFLTENVKSTKTMLNSRVIEFDEMFGFKSNAGDFDKFGPFNNWKIFDITNTSFTTSKSPNNHKYWGGFNGDFSGNHFKINQEELLGNRLGIQKIETPSMLSEKDKEIEATAMRYFIAAIVLQIGIEAGPAVVGSVCPGFGTGIGAVVGNFVGAGIDFGDMLSDTEVLLDMCQKSGLVDTNYRMSKTWLDNVLAGIGLIPGATIGLKSLKLGKLIKKYGNVNSKMIEEVGEAFMKKGGKQAISSEGDIIETTKTMNRIDLADFEKLGLTEKLKALGIPKEFYDLLNESGLVKQGVNLVDRYKKLKYGDILRTNKLQINYEEMIEKALIKFPNLTKQEAFLIFAYTDEFLFNNLNFKLRTAGYEVLTSGEKKVVDALNTALMKMPELEGDFIVRGDSWKGWLTPDTNLSDIKNLEIIKMIQEGKVKGYKSGDIIDLHGFTSVSNNLDDIFIGKGWETKDTLIVIRGEKGKIRDISDLAMFTNFAKELGKPATKFEGVVLSNSKVAFKGAEIKYIELTDKITGEIYKQKVLEITVDGIR